MRFPKWFFLSSMCVPIVWSNVDHQSMNGMNTHTNNEVKMLATMLTQLTNELARQEATMTKYHTEVVTILEKQSKLLSKLLKKQGKKSMSKLPSPLSTPMKASMNASTSTQSPVTGLGLSPDWSYSSSWADSYPICGEGGQSPVNLETVDVAVREHKALLQFTYYDKINSDTCKLVNTGNSATLLLTTSLSNNPAMFGGPLNTTYYYFHQAVFHWGSDDNLGSDHTIRTISYPMEMQLIHGSTSEEEQKLAVASFLFEISPQDNPFLAPVISKLANIQVAGSEVPLNTTETANDITSVTSSDDNYRASDSFFMDQLMQESISGPYFSYKGSLTFPPCSMVEQWVVFRTPLDISIAQLEQFRKLLKKDGSRIGGNFRPVQPLGKRILAFTM